MLKRALPVIATAAIMLGASAQRLLFRTAPADAAPYHAAVREAAEALPLHFGSWLGMDVPVPQAAIELLHPNVIVSRKYENVSTGESVSFLLVQVTDARDILGHYPPVCYRGQGWTLDAATPTDWVADDGWVVTGTQYEFSSSRSGRRAEIVVDNFLVLPDGTICRDMNAVERSATDNRVKFFGAAQVQLVYDSAIAPERRQEMFQSFLRASRPVIDQMCRGGAQ